MSQSPERTVLAVALASRLLLITLIALSRLLFRPYDTSAALNPSCLSPNDKSPPSNGVLWPRFGAIIEDSVVWDGVYFVRIAECGYEYEQTYAFLPLLPGCMVFLAKYGFGVLVPLIGDRAVLALAGYVINNVAFLFAALFFYRLSILVLKDSRAALRASVLFCFNPASVFYSSIYSESLYALFSLGGVYYLFSGADNVSMILLALSGSARSNGALNAGYFCFRALVQVYDIIHQKKSLIVFTVKPAVVAVVRSVIIFMPFVAFQAYGYFNMCMNKNADELRPWCRAKVPLLYGFLQSHYWGVGFLRYFQIKQLPNFLLASPVLSLAVYSIIHYATTLLEALKALSMYKRNGTSIKETPVHTNKDLHSNLYPKNESSSKSLQGDYLVRSRRQDIKNDISDALKDPQSDCANVQEKYGPEIIIYLPFILHLAFMTFTAFFVMHVQVSTRFLSASPLIYWFASRSSTYRQLGYLVWAYCISYILLGSLLFSNFYPFT